MAHTSEIDNTVIEKVAKLDVRIDKLKERIAADTAQCAKLMEKRNLLVFRSIQSGYRLEGQALVDMIRREHEQVKMFDAENTPDADNNDANNDETHGQFSFNHEKRNPYSD